MKLDTMRFTYNDVTKICKSPKLVDNIFDEHFENF